LNTLKMLRIQKGLSIRELAKQSGVGSATITRIEGGGKAYATTLAKLAEFFQVDYERLQEFEAISPKSVALMTVNLQGDNFVTATGVTALAAAY
jgi:transcriptional regulator with XRE-family HTH domain